MLQQLSDHGPPMDEQFSSALLKALHATAWECDPVTLSIIHIDSRIESILGYPRYRWLMEPGFWRFISHPDDWEQCAVLLVEAVTKMENRELEHRLTAANGSQIWLRTIIIPARTANGAIRLRGVMMDIAGSKLATTRPQSDDERFQLAMQGANDGLWDWNLLTQEVYYCPRWKSMFGYGDHELEHTLDVWANLTHPSDRQSALDMAKDYIAGRRDAYEIELRMKHRDGHAINVLSRAFLARDAQGRAVRLVGVHIDITRLKQAENELYLARYCLEKAPIGIIKLDLDLAVLYANDHACKNLGYSYEELVGMTIFDFDPVFNREDQLELREELRKNGSVAFETVHRNRDGLVIPMEITVAHLEHQGKEFLFSFERDISERKLTEQVLREQEELYSAMFNEAPDGIVLVDAETMEVLEFNDMACQTLGYNREEFGSLNLEDIHAEFNREQHKSRIQEVITSGRIVFENIHRHRDGSLRNVRASARLVKIRERRYFLVFWTDITEHTRLQEEIRLREYYQRALLDNFPFAAWIKNKEGRFLAVNRQLATLLGLSSPKDLVGKTIFDVAPAALAEINAENDRAVLVSGKPKRTEEQLPVGGENRWFEIYLSPVSFDGMNIGAVGCTWDITERKGIEQALRESEERYRKLVELSPDAVFIHNGDRFVFMNQAAATLLGANVPEDLYGQNPLDFIHPGQREMAKKRIGDALAEVDNTPTEKLFVRLDGSPVPVEMVSVHYVHQGEHAVLAIARDISERKRAQEELVKAQKLESLGLLAGGIAHDFNNILTGIMGNVSLVRARLNHSNPLVDRLEDCEKAAKRATGLTRQLLTFAKGGEPVRRVIDSTVLIRESAAFVLRGSNVKSDIRLGEGLWCIDADANQISQVLNNLIINAAHSMPDGGVVAIKASNENLDHGQWLNLPAGTYLNISVQDHGCGIPEENLTRIFDPYFTTKSQGSGLGLTSVYSIIRRHGGTIEVSSRIGEGTTFVIHLPAVPLGGGATVCRQVAAESAVSGKILVMDDDELIRQISKEMLEYTGYSVECCVDGRQAVELFLRARDNGAPFKAAIMDLTIPGGMGGEEAARLLLEADPEAVLIVASGYANDPVLADFQRYGFSGAVVKPFDLEALVGEVLRLTE